MDPITPALISLAGFIVCGTLWLRSYRRYRDATRRLEEAKAAREEALSILSKAEVIVRETITTHALVLLDATDLPTPGCKCAVCAARRAAADAK